MCPFYNFIMSKIATKSEIKLSESRSIDRSSLVEIDKKYALMEMSSQRQVTTQLENQLDYLLGKKEREALKKKKLMEMEELYQKQRQNRKSRISFKISRSDKNRESTINERRNRTKSQLETVERIKKKVKHDNEEEIQKMMGLQKQLSQRKTDSRSSKTSLNGNKTMRDRTPYLKNTNNKPNQIDNEIQKIQAKINQAKSNSLLFHNQLAEKAKSYSKNYEEIMDKIRAEELKDEMKCYKDYYHRATHILECQDKSKSFYQRESDRKKKNIDYKFDRANQNLKEIDKRRQNKLEELQIKFNKSFAPKTWKNQKNELYLSKFFKNQQELEHEKSLKAQNILKKHFDLSLKNKALRQKKDRILQTVKKIEY